ncbi:hypothetical protein PRIPAC_83096 [Pristionchus pacificus]|uniref:Uncharacterized protein n=1 Tax=Pristionchus pacificus TaxID=54126 RepID=A0A454Y2I8_PRIPA|nr:hypothetical protein PRIPAC_83096 [Pristionchus pacificus]|eukprot:PDM67442.1 hypothetical protein PRIPAC_48859 [Pristionchus pacificus]
MLNSTLYDDLKNCFEEMKNPDNVEETLLKMSRMDVTSEVLEATNASRLIMDYFYQSTCGDLARRLAMDWLRIRTLKVPELRLKRKSKMGDSIAHKKIQNSVDEKNISSVTAIKENNEKKLNQIPVKERIPKPTVEVAKSVPLPSAPSTSFLTRLTTTPAEEYRPDDDPAMRIAHFQKEAEKYAAKSRQASPPLDVSTSSTSYATPSTEKTLEQRLAKEIEKFEATKRTTKPAPAIAASNASGVDRKKTADETRFAEVLQKAAKKKAEKDATQRKTVVIPEHDYTAKSRRSKKEFK